MPETALPDAEDSAIELINRIVDAVVLGREDEVVGCTDEPLRTSFRDRATTRGSLHEVIRRIGPVRSIPVPMVVSDHRAALVIFYVQADDGVTAIPMYAAMTRSAPSAPWRVFELAERSGSGQVFEQARDEAEKA